MSGILVPGISFAYVCDHMAVGDRIIQSEWLSLRQEKKPFSWVYEGEEAHVNRNKIYPSMLCAALRGNSTVLILPFSDSHCACDIPAQSHLCCRNIVLASTTCGNIFFFESGSVFSFFDVFCYRFLLGQEMRLESLVTIPSFLFRCNQSQFSGGRKQNELGPWGTIQSFLFRCNSSQFSVASSNFCYTFEMHWSWDGMECCLGLRERFGLFFFDVKGHSSLMK